MGSNQRPLVPVDQKEPDLKRVSDSTKSGAHGSSWVPCEQKAYPDGFSDCNRTGTVLCEHSLYLDGSLMLLLFFLL